MSRVLAALATLAIVASSFAVTSNVALGHEHRSVGPYTFVVGWINEPAYVNAANGLSLDVTETSSSKPVEGLATSLQAEVIVGGGAKKLVLDLATDEESPGHYTGAFVPTKVGDYIFHVFGDVGSTKVDERFESGPNTFDGVVSTDQLQFPDRVAANADLSARLDSMQTLVIAAIVIAGLALLASVGGLVTRRR
ncbi:MAG: hypothetical protein E6H87_10670 [Chloroflexi bacterium]|nr:MAG: hypothetical protein E6I14_04600 [Chloroflexota bacterium]TMG58778.1 MAG: hypothetical protein E6H87_10670 [Chloroflexota bacterium]